jgi:hypothetical protein
MKKILIAALAPLLITACGKSSGEQYLGHWTKVAGQGPDLTIEKHADVFVIKEPSVLIAGQFDQYTADMVGERLVLHAGIGGEIPVVIDKSTGHLLLAGEELARGGK